MKKKVVFGNGSFKMMSYEEVLKQFEPMLHKFAISAINKLPDGKGDKEEIMQEYRLEMWYAFDKYDEKHAFSTYLHYQLQKVTLQYSSTFFAQKRTNNGETSMNQSLDLGDGEATMENILGELDQDVESVEFLEYIKYLDEVLNEEEQLIVRHFIDKKGLPVQELGNIWGITRIGANKRVNNCRKKLKNILKSTGYVEFC